MSLAATAARALCLNGRARHGAVGAIHAAVARQRLEHRVAVRTLVEPLAGVGGHLFGLRVLAGRAGQNGSKDRNFGFSGEHGPGDFGLYRDTSTA